MVARGRRSLSRMPLARLAALGPVGPSLTARGPAWLCSEEGLGGVWGQVTGHAAVDDIGEVALEDAAGLLLGVARARALA